MTDADRLRSYLSTLSAEALERHLDLRPDVLAGAPLRDLDDLAERLVHPSGIAAALSAAPLPVHQVLQVLTASGAGASEARAVELLDSRGAGGQHAKDVRRIVAALRDQVLVWPAGGKQLVVNPGVRVFIDVPLGMGPSAEALLGQATADTLRQAMRRWGGAVPTRKADLLQAVVAGLGDPVHVRRLVSTAPSDVVRRLFDLAEYAARRAGARGLPAWTGPADDTVDMYLRTPAEYRAEREMAAWLRDHGLAFSTWSTFGGDAEIPAEVLLALVPDGTALPFDPQPPPVPRATVTAAQVASTAAGAVTELLSAAMGMLEVVGREPLATVRTGGVGAREMKALGKRLGIEPRDVRLTLELAASLDLLGQDRSGAIRAAPTFDRWRERPPAERVADLLIAWHSLDGTPTRDRDENGKSIPALSGDDGRASHLVREVLLVALAAGAHDTGIVSVDALAGFLTWQTPTILGEDPSHLVGLMWAETERLGIAAHGTLSDIGRAVLDGDRGALVSALTAALPAVQRTALFGSDLTAVVPGTPTAAVVDLLDATATRESRGSASTWRVTPDSVRRALDDGYEAEDLLTRLRALSDGGLPQALEYLVRDVGRRYGHVAVRPAGAVLVGDDEALLAELAAHRSLQRLGLRRVAPTVLVAAQPPGDVVPALRKAGYLPRHLDADGDPVVRVRRHLQPAVQRVEDRTLVAEGDIRPLGLVGADGDDQDDERPIADDALDLWAEAHAILLGEDVDEDEDGDDGRPWPPAVAGLEPPQQTAERLVRGILPAERSTASAVRTEIAASARKLTPSEVRQLAHAVTERTPVRIEYRSSSGGRSLRVVSDLEIGNGHLRGWCHLRDAERVFTIANILSVGPV